MADDPRDTQPLITRFFGKLTATEQAKELVKVTEARDDMLDNEKEVLAQDITKEMKNSSRTDVKLQQYSDSFRTEMIKRVNEGSQKSALKWARETQGIVLAKSTLNTWVKKRSHIEDSPTGQLMYKSKVRGPKFKMPEEVEKFVLDNLKVYQSKGVTITFFVARYVSLMICYNFPFRHVSTQNAF